MAPLKDHSYLGISIGGGHYWVLHRVHHVYTIFILLHDSGGWSTWSETPISDTLGTCVRESLALVKLPCQCSAPLFGWYQIYTDKWSASEAACRCRYIDCLLRDDGCCWEMTKAFTLELQLYSTHPLEAEV